MYPNTAKCIQIQQIVCKDNKMYSNTANVVKIHQIYLNFSNVFKKVFDMYSKVIKCSECFTSLKNCLKWTPKRPKKSSKRLKKAFKKA